MRSFFCLLLGVSLSTATYAAVENAQQCDLSAAEVPVLASAPQQGYLRYITWFSRPIVNTQQPWLVAFSGGNRDKVDEERNQAIDLASGRMMEIPGRGDAVTTPDGRYLTVPPEYSQDEGKTFDIYRAADVLAKWRSQAKVATDIPRLGHVDYGAWYQSLSFPLNEGENGKFRYRAVVSEPGANGFRLMEFTVSDHGIEGVPQQAKLCADSDNQTVMLSKSGRYVSGFDRASGTTKIYAITPHWDQKPATVDCKVVVDFGFAAGKGDFNFDDSMITFHVNFMTDPTAEETGLSYVHEILPHEAKDAVVVKFAMTGGMISGVSSVARLSIAQHEGTGSYFPAFLPDGKVYFIHHDNGVGYRFKVVDPAAAVWSNNLFKPRNSKFAEAAAIGSLWASNCHSWTLKDEEAAWYFSSLTREQCKTLVQQHWTAPAATSSANVSKTQALAACEAKSR